MTKIVHVVRHETDTETGLMEAFQTLFVDAEQQYRARVGNAGLMALSRAFMEVAEELEDACAENELSLEEVNVELGKRFALVERRVEARDRAARAAKVALQVLTDGRALGQNARRREATRLLRKGVEGDGEVCGCVKLSKAQVADPTCKLCDGIGERWS